MASGGRQSSSYSEELFEFVDYTSVSNFERLVTAIEEVLLSWGVKDNSYGVFSDDMLSMVNDSVTTTAPFEFTRKESLSVGTETYKLAYHCHPYATTLQTAPSTQPLVLENYYQCEPPLSSAETTKTFHPLHRWTGLGRFFILAPVSDSIKSKLFASSRVSVDIHQAKLLLSASAIAFNNVRCPVPVFISVGQARYDSYTGYMLNHNGEMDLEVRFNSTVISSPPMHCHMNGFQELFLQNLNTNRFDNGFPPLSSIEKHSILKGAVFTYNLKNWFNEHWKQWDDDESKDSNNADDRKKYDNDVDDEDDDDDDNYGPSITRARTAHLNSYANRVLRSDDDSNKESHTAPLPSLPFGSYNDPLRTMTLGAVFPLSINTANRYTDDAIHSNMDALTADFWELTREFAPSSQQRAFLSTLLDRAISSWVKDPSNRDYLAPYDSNNNNNNNTSGDDSSERGNSTGLMRNLLHAMSHNRGGPMTQQGNQVAVVKSDQVEIIMDAVFKSNSQHNNNGSSNDQIKLRKVNEDLSIFTPSALGLRLKHGASVPYKSLLWNLVVYELDALQEMSKGGYGASASSTTASSASSYMGFLRILWVEIIRQIRWHWENLIPIPNVNPYMYRPSKNQDDPNTSEQDSNDTSTLGIDLSYNILHQKLTMINCCIHQSMNDISSHGNISPPMAPNRKNVASLFDDIQNTKMDVKSENNHNNSTDSFNDSLEKLTDLDSLIPNNAKVEQSMRSGVDSDISEGELFFDSVDDLESKIPTTGPSTELEQQVQETDATTDNQHSKKKHRTSASSCSSFISDVSELAHPASMQESFVRLNYSTSAESDPCQHVPSQFTDIQDWSSGMNKSSEIQDPDAFEGRSHQHETIKLMKTKNPLWVPITQNPGFMTEDMIQQQADVFESLGTSDDAAQLRAKLQSAQLYSDMQAFKAANPHAVLEDFVRWHSPKDWIENSDRQSPGCLSARMSEPTNIWQELWKCSRRVPVSRQRSLFNLTAEGEKALHYLECLSVHDIFSLLLPTMGLIMYDTLVSQPVVKYIRPVTSGINKLANELIDYPWDALRNGTCSFGSIITRVKQEESLMCNAISLLRKFPKQYDLVERLLNDSRTRIKEGDERTAVFNLYKNEYGMISKPSYKEYVFYMNNSLSIDHPLPYRQYVLLKDDELRLWDMHSTDGRYR
ncbi:Rab3 GTPase-activating protein catalytic subunit-domain-containing protein [Absidia repens]|uniref:Rab3 GTPase-activating protein catalytic subunit n=1 Tax=Absidia repens TaxID=90262 RepID=A0A1X2IL68_9FUNG|nr:Rab3 GTPase-activating protein catalytic subunit-domain-containing protein [Absidia repens]